MKKIEECEIGDFVRPIMDGWKCDGGSGFLFQNQEYTVTRFFRDEKGRKAPYSWVRVVDASGKEWFPMNFGRMVISRLEPPPTLAELAAMPQEVWLGADGVYREDGINRQRLMQMLRAAKEQGIHVPRKIDTRPKRDDRMYKILGADIAIAMTLKPQARTLVRLMLDIKKPEGFSERELNDVLLKSHEDLKTRQDPWKVFNFYKRDLVAAGVLEITEPDE